MPVIIRGNGGCRKRCFLVVGSIFLGSSLSWHGFAGAAPIATVEVTDGTVFVRSAGNKQRIIAKDSQIEAGDTITTEKESYVRLRFTDGSEMAVRPSSSIRIDNYHFQDWQPNRDTLSMRLVKGGLRTQTGMIGKRGNPDAYRLNGAAATIGVLGTDFIARVCDTDCATEVRPAGNGKKNGKNALPPSANPIAARLFQAEGAVTVTPLGGKPRPLMQGEPLYSGDKVETSTSGFAALVFSDESRAVVNRGSTYTVTAYRYVPKAEERNQMLTDLVKGGLRVVTGRMGKRAPERIQFSTVTASIGIRGTNFDLLCAPTGSQENPNFDPADNGPTTCDQALYASTRDGAIEISSGQAKLVVPKGQVGYVDAPGAIPVLLDNPPAFMRDNTAPLPELLDVDMPTLFGKNGSEISQPGLYVMVKDGRVSLTQQSGDQIELHAGETGFAGKEGQELFKMGSPPSFIDQDNYLRDMGVDPASCRAN